MKNILPILFVLFFISCSKDDLSLSTRESNTTGVNGSLTRFAIKDNFLYAIDVNYLKTFDISNNDNPVFISSVKVGYGLETIFIYDHYIYLGAVDGVYIVDINNPTSPIELQKIVHHVSCDPVVVQNNYAYSTQRSNATGCGTTWHQSSLAVYDVSDPSDAPLVESIPMNQPYGLAVEGNWLYVCDPGKGGVVVFDISNPILPQQITVAAVSDPRDIILQYPCMIVVTKNKFELYNYADPQNIYLISSLNIS